MRYVHTNLVARDWRTLAAFYESVFGCVPTGPRRDQAGPWLDRGVGVEGVRLEGVHLLLPGHGPDGPTLEIYTYAPALDAPPPEPNRFGLGHLAFRVDDVRRVLDAVLAAGGSAQGQVSGAHVEGVGTLEFVYARDPEGNVLELQSWR
ncbi:MAG: VOC family protein [Longimicrobiales bacterium]